ncbi:hypothetical protein HYALB_00010047 [Hymenoscyphus albidus]|uniref:Sec1-like protein n=1 Tax=Hymenoscyphus albidus TaxID=595503 RepID=A0A9N9LKX1_9HELO|nr:hypothetical protein HYALB_00010047 [Hymenoscyphus albidus]
MGLSMIREQREIILSTIKAITRGDWKVLVIDEYSKKILDNAVKEDDILNENIANIEKIEDRRQMSPDMDAIYLISPKSHIVDCLMADFERHRYKRSYLVWTSLLEPRIRDRIDRSDMAKAQIAGFQTISVNFFPRESNLITFRDPHSFQLLYNPTCSSLVQGHVFELAKQIVDCVVSLGENPKVRFFQPRPFIPRTPTDQDQYGPRILSGYLAQVVQDELDLYMRYNPDFPPPSNRPQGVLMIADRSFDLMAPLLHEFTYQAMAHDLLPIKEGEKVMYTTVVNEGTGAQEEKDMEIGEKDKIWVENRHRHMKDTIEKLMGDFQKFIDENPHFTNAEGDATSLNAIKDMLAGLPQFQELKEAYSLHLSMAQECMNIFEKHKLPDLALVEQTLATGLDEDFRKPKNMADQVVRILDDPSVGPSDRLRLIMMYCLYREGVIQEDIERLLFHSGLPYTTADANVVTNLDLLGGRTLKADVKDKQINAPPILAKKAAPTAQDEEFALSRFEPNVKLMLEELAKGTLDQSLFPYLRPPTDNSTELALQSQTSLRSAKPTWARNRMSTVDNRQRIFVYMAGGATYSEARSCYEVANTRGRDVILVTSHMQTPETFVQDMRNLDAKRNTLGFPIDGPQPRAPEYLFKKNDPPPPRPVQPVQQAMPTQQRPSALQAGRPGGQMPMSGKALPMQPPTAGMAAMSMNSSPSTGRQPMQLGPQNGMSSHKPDKKSNHDGEEKAKKKRGFFGKRKDKS